MGFGFTPVFENQAHQLLILLEKFTSLSLNFLRFVNAYLPQRTVVRNILANAWVDYNVKSINMYNFPSKIIF